MGLLGGSVHYGKDPCSTLFCGDGVEVFEFSAHGSSCGPGHIGSNHSRAVASANVYESELNDVLDRERGYIADLLVDLLGNVVDPGLT